MNNKKTRLFPVSIIFLLVVFAFFQIANAATPNFITGLGVGTGYKVNFVANTDGLVWPGGSINSSAYTGLSANASSAANAETAAALAADGSNCGTGTYPLGIDAAGNVQSCTTLPSLTETDPQVGANTLNYLSKWNGSALITSVVYDNGTNVGIGTATPSQKLEVIGNINASVNVVAYGFQGNGNVGGTGAASWHPNGIYSAGTNWLYGLINTNGTLNDVNSKWTINPTGNVYFNTGGNFGIGTTNPGVKLDVQGGTNAYGANIYGMWTPDGNSLIRNWALNDGQNNYTQGTYTSVSDGPLGSKTMRFSSGANWRNAQWVPVDTTRTYKVSVWGRTISGTPNNYLSLTQATHDLSQPVNGGWGNPYWGVVNQPFPASWTYYTMTIGPAGSGADYNWSAGTKYVQLGALMIYTGSGVAEMTGYKMEEVPSTIAAGTKALGNFIVNGNVGIGTTNPTEKLYVVGNISGVSFIYNSDRNLKKNIKTISDPLDKILNLRGVTFNWKADGKPAVGLIAQEVEKVFPELVTGVEGSKGVQYGNLVAPLIEAVKAQQQEINTLETRIEILERNK